MATEDHLLVAALDFGTTYSGYAFSMRHEFKTDPMKIHANQAWNSGGRALLSLKTPTCLLLNEKKQFIALNISSEMFLEDILGKPVSAVDVFSLSIKALVDHFMDSVKKQGTGVKIQEIQWVLTIPAIWTDAAKQFMRECAEKANIPPENCCWLLNQKPLVYSASICRLKNYTEQTRLLQCQLRGLGTWLPTWEVLPDAGEDTRWTSDEKIKDEDPAAYLDLFREFEAVKRTIVTGKEEK
ncbi:unnamed protein product [Mytilus edulis]|uniref:Uncharacterized protein n=1 Tax=Mytilus edulis TaxID=6550 RepID=A0A8S3Q7P9_MYTED|nr:unnamed protein product [Mytilus edulis]